MHDVVVDEASLADTFREDVLAGLAKKPQKALPPKHLYDARGSELFDGICRTRDYYPTRTEASIYEANLDEISSAIGPNAVVIEPGSGSAEKTELKLEALVDPSVFVPIEISMSALMESSERIAERFPEIEVMPACADFTRSDAVPDGVPEERRVVFFPGSTLGNFEPKERAALVKWFRSIAGDGGMLLIGTDLEKDVDVLRAAYDDSEGVTAAFNLNLLDRINRELAGNFDRGTFRHEARWVDEHRRIEMHLVSQEAQDVSVGGETFSFAAGESIHTECSHKFTPERIDAELGVASFEPMGAWTDGRGWFRVGLYRAV